MWCCLISRFNFFLEESDFESENEIMVLALLSVSSCDVIESRHMHLIFLFTVWWFGVVMSEFAFKLRKINLVHPLQVHELIHAVILFRMNVICSYFFCFSDTFSNRFAPISNHSNLPLMSQKNATSDNWVIGKLT